MTHGPGPWEREGPSGERALSTQRGAAGSFHLEHLAKLSLGTRCRPARSEVHMHQMGDTRLPIFLHPSLGRAGYLRPPKGAQRLRILHRRCTVWRDGRRWPRDGGQLCPVGGVRPTMAGILHLPAPGASLLAGYGTSACPSPPHGHSAAPRVSNVGTASFTTQSEEPREKDRFCVLRAKRNGAQAQSPSGFDPVFNESSLGRFTSRLARAAHATSPASRQDPRQPRARRTPKWGPR